MNEPEQQEEEAHFAEIRGVSAAIIIRSRADNDQPIA
jgi:hypothetical protein